MRKNIDIVPRNPPLRKQFFYEPCNYKNCESVGLAHMPLNQPHYRSEQTFGHGQEHPGHETLNGRNHVPFGPVYYHGSSPYQNLMSGHYHWYPNMNSVSTSHSHHHHRNSDSILGKERKKVLKIEHSSEEIKEHHGISKSVYNIPHRDDISEEIAGNGISNKSKHPKSSRLPSGERVNFNEANQYNLKISQTLRDDRNSYDKMKYLLNVYDRHPMQAMNNNNNDYDDADANDTGENNSDDRFMSLEHNSPGGPYRNKYGVDQPSSYTFYDINNVDGASIS